MHRREYEKPENSVLEFASLATVGKEPNALGNNFAECYIRHRTIGILIHLIIGKAVAECQSGVLDKKKWETKTAVLELKQTVDGERFAPANRPPPPFSSCAPVAPCGGGVRPTLHPSSAPFLSLPRRRHRQWLPGEAHGTPAAVACLSPRRGRVDAGVTLPGGGALRPASVRRVVGGHGGGGTAIGGGEPR